MSDHGTNCTGCLMLKYVEEGEAARHQHAALAARVEALADEYPPPSENGRRGDPLGIARAARRAVALRFRALLSDTDTTALADRDREVAAKALEEAADGIQALHPGEVKNSVIWLRDRARAERGDS